MTRSSQAVIEVDRRAEYATHPAVRQEPTFNARFRRGLVIQKLMRRKWRRESKT